MHLSQTPFFSFLPHFSEYPTALQALHLQKISAPTEKPNSLEFDYVLIAV